jgi:hypothetical protein
MRDMSRRALVRSLLDGARARREHGGLDRATTVQIETSATYVLRQELLAAGPMREGSIGCDICMGHGSEHEIGVGPRHGPHRVCPLHGGRAAGAGRVSVPLARDQWVLKLVSQTPLVRRPEAVREEWVLKREVYPGHTKRYRIRTTSEWRDILVHATPDRGRREQIGSRAILVEEIVEAAISTGAGPVAPREETTIDEAWLTAREDEDGYYFTQEGPQPEPRV